MTVQFVDGHFVDSYYPTIENTFSKMIKYKNQDYATEIIDTAGQVLEVFFSPRVAESSPAPHPTLAVLRAPRRGHASVHTRTRRLKPSVKKSISLTRLLLPRMNTAFLTRSISLASMDT
jgi:hypothetical protein